MNACFVAAITPIWIGILFNLVMVIANFAIPYRSEFGQWYFEKSGGPKVMISAWVIFVAWAIVNGMSCW